MKPKELYKQCTADKRMYWEAMFKVARKPESWGLCVLNSKKSRRQPQQPLTGNTPPHRHKCIPAQLQHCQWQVCVAKPSQT